MLRDASSTPPTLRYHARRAEVATILEQALELTVDERGHLIAQLFDSLEPADAELLDEAAWRDARAAEIDRRVRDIDSGAVELIDGDVALARVRAAVTARRR